MSSAASTAPTFIQTAEGDVISALKGAATQAETQLLGLAETALADLKAALNTALADAEAGASIETIETAVLNLLSADSLPLIQSLASGTIQFLITAGKTLVADL